MREPTVPYPFQPPAEHGIQVDELPIHEVLSVLRSWFAVTLREHLHAAAGADWDPEHPDSVAYHEDVDIQVDRTDVRLYALQRALFDAYPNDIPEPERPEARPGWGVVDRAAQRIVHVHDVSAGQDVVITAISSGHGRNIIGGHVFTGEPGEHR